MARNYYTKGVTPVGTALWSHLLSTERFQDKDTGCYAISLELAPADEKALVRKLEQEWTKFAESEDGRKHKYKYDPAIGLHEGKDNNPNYFKFKMRASIPKKDGTFWERHVPVYDAGCKEISKEIAELGNGSKVKIAYELVPYYMNDKNYGVSLRLTAVQVIELKTQEEKAEDFGFGMEEGFRKEDNPVGETISDDEIPFEVREEEEGGVTEF